MIDSEQIFCRVKTATSFSNCQRGFNGTTAANRGNNPQYIRVRVRPHWFRPETERPCLVELLNSRSSDDIPVREILVLKMSRVSRASFINHPIEAMRACLVSWQLRGQGWAEEVGLAAELMDVDFSQGVVQMDVESGICRPREAITKSRSRYPIGCTSLTRQSPLPGWQVEQATTSMQSSRRTRRKGFAGACGCRVPCSSDPSGSGRLLSLFQGGEEREDALARDGDVCRWEHSGRRRAGPVPAGAGISRAGAT